MLMRISVISIIVAGLLSLSQQAALSARDGDTNRVTKATKNSTASQATKSKGTIVEIDETLNKLRDARLAISRVRKESANLYDEVTRHHMRHNTTMIGTTVMSLASKNFSGKTLPARKRWVDASMAVLGPIISLFKEDVDVAVENNRQTKVSEPVKVAFTSLRTDAVKAVNSSFAIYKHLQSLTAGDNYDNAAIADDVKNLDAQMLALDSSLRNGVSILQKEARKR